jgi:uncharacterized membrane protein YhaH (DUF805 family)
MIPLLLIINSIFLHNDIGFKYYEIFLLAVPIYLIFVFVINPLLIVRNLEKDERLSNLLQFEFNDEQILCKTKFIETKLDWGSFQKVVESSDYFLLVYSTNKNLFQYIPKRAFATTEKEQEFRNYLNIKIPTNQKTQIDIKLPIATLVILIVIGFCLLIFMLATISYLQNG